MFRGSAAIAFNGVAQSGKDTSGQYLVENYGFTRISFADAVRESYYKLNPVIPVYGEQITELGLFFAKAVAVDSDNGVMCIRLQEIVDKIGWDKAKLIKEVREGLQKTGTECGREIHGDDCWLRIVERKADGKDKIVFTDARFPNEIEFVRNLGYLNTSIVQIIHPERQSINDHKSDQLLPSELIDVQLHNDGDIDELKMKLDYIVETL